jgi:hypothetical protein
VDETPDLDKVYNIYTVEQLLLIYKSMVRIIYTCQKKLRDMDD